jgi:amino acid adenylation domain-containing protein
MAPPQLTNPLPPPEVLSVENDTDTVVARIAARTATSPNALAIVDATGPLTFANLDRRANRLVASLIRAGADPDCCVGLLLDRSADFVVAALAVLKTGAAYLPLDPCTPMDRVSAILTDAGAAVLVSHSTKAAHCPPGPWQVIAVDGEKPDEEDHDFDAISPSATPAHESNSLAPWRVAPDPESLAYIVYTSGSAGRPKGVEITHANLLNLIDWHQAAFRVTSADRASLVAGLGFDAAAWEIWPHLAAGASLHIADESTRRSPQMLRDWLVAGRITISFVPTVLAEQLLHADWPAETALRTLLTGADVLHRRPVAGLPFALVNNYGPSECTVVATSGIVRPDAEFTGPPSIGRPIRNTTVHILDEALQPVPDGEPGELCLAGALVGRGYRNLLEQTASRFVSYSPPDGAPLRIYRTGDRARLLPNGEIAFLGRLDEQIKIRGYRIEPGEIVACLDRYPGIEASAVVAGTGAITAEGNAGPQLVAYVVIAASAKLTTTDLREFLAARLPDYMIPSRFVRLDALPTTANGKLDRGALPAPNTRNMLEHRSAPVPSIAHADGMQAKLASLVASLLGQPSVGPDDNFFMIGGHSMLGVQLVARIKTEFGVKLTLRQLFSAPTVAALSVEVERLASAHNV